MSFTFNISVFKRLNPFVKTTESLTAKKKAPVSVYDKIEVIFFIANYNSKNPEIILKFNQLNQIEQQLTIVALIEHKMFEPLAYILDSGVDVNFMIRGQSPLHFAINDQNLAIINLLISHHADLECENRYQESPMTLAVRSGNEDVISSLLYGGAKVTAEIKNRKQPVIFAKAS